MLIPQLKDKRGVQAHTFLNHLVDNGANEAWFPVILSNVPCVFLTSAIPQPKNIFCDLPSTKFHCLLNTISFHCYSRSKHIS